MPRKTIPSATRTLVLLQAGYKCANPVCRHILTLELHHIVWVKDGGDNSPENLVALCPNCHSLHTQKHIPHEAIQVWKQLLISLNDANRITADLLLVLYREEQRVVESKDSASADPPFRFSGDSLPALSGLINSGLLQIGERFRGGGAFDKSPPTFEVRLTKKGNRFVKAWLDGSSDGVLKVVGSGG